ncbi:MAG: GNAT family N-acetyltransferase [Candidatus Bathyarchaeota archaeon]|nr:GNAT family N-acetyltransferase [Candidatus Bathyarchaeota archaeon]MDH5688911.1 GNAT family N-acetyltransferase [Candidatus Bathyarchaeota archaeon]
MLRIRRFVQGDEEIYLRVWHQGFTTEEWWELISEVMEKPADPEDVTKLDFDAAFFADLDGEAVGLIEIKFQEDKAHIRNLVVLKNFRRKGIGTKLVEKAIEFSRSKGIKRIRVKTPTRDASRFYEKNGFKLIDYLFVIRLPYWDRATVMTEKGVEFMRKHGTNFETVSRFEVMIRELS